MMASLDYNFSKILLLFLMLIRAIVIQTPPGHQNLNNNNKEKAKGVLAVVK